MFASLMMRGVLRDGGVSHRHTCTGVVFFLNIKGSPVDFGLCMDIRLTQILVGLPPLHLGLNLFKVLELYPTVLPNDPVQVVFQPAESAVRGAQP